MLLNNLYDSHVHLLLSGMSQMELPLRDILNVKDLSRLEIRREYFRGSFLMGFGWDEGLFHNGVLPTRHDLDVLFPETPVYFVRCDGHSAWLNTLALQKLDLFSRDIIDPHGGQVLRGGDGFPNGILTETAHFPYYEKLSQLSDADFATALREGIRLFNKNGFTHIRDLSGTDRQWNYLHRMHDAGELTIHVEDFFSCENIQDFDKTLASAKNAHKESNQYLKARGVKFYIDGSLGSDTALLSKPYAHRSDGAIGLTCTDFKVAKDVVRQTWEAGLDIAVHTIGDEAAHQMVLIARELSSQGLSGKINLEHCQVLRPDTIQMMKALHVHCHLQPCHWLSDRKWLKEKLGDLYKFAFPWENLRLNNISFSFGSDSPIEYPSFFASKKAIESSPADGIKKLGVDLVLYHQYQGKNSVTGQTEISDGKITSVRVGDRTLELPS